MYLFSKEHIKVKVCQNFLFNTRYVMKEYVQDTLNRQSDIGMLQQLTGGKHGIHKKWSKALIASGKRHIECFPKVKYSVAMAF